MQHDNSIYHIATPMRRLAAFVYDGMLILALLFLVGAALTLVGTLLFLEIGTHAKEAKRLPMWYQNLVMTPSFLLTLIGFYGVFWRKSGQTLGMQTWHIQAIDAYGGLLSWTRVWWRMLSASTLPLIFFILMMLFTNRLGALLAAMIGFLGNYIFAWLHPRGLCLHDVLSNTMVIKIPKHQHSSIFKKKEK